MKRGRIQRNGQCLVPMVWRADNPWTRLRGLLGRGRLRGDGAEGLLLVPCGSVHTFWMDYPLDLVFLDADDRVLGWHAALKPWRAKGWRGARQTLELLTGSLARLQPREGEVWSWREA